MLNIPFSERFTLELAPTYSTVLDQPRWRSLDLQLSPEYNINKHLDIVSAILYNNTFQNAQVTTNEIREMIGVRYYLTPDQWYSTRLLLRLEQRNQYDKSTDTWNHSTRSRLRAEAVIPLKRRKLSDGDKIWYVLTDIEGFIVLDKDLEERFANRLRYRAGVGYKFNTMFRAEVVYTLQLSRNTIEGDMSTADNIIRLRLKQFLPLRKK